MKNKLLLNLLLIAVMGILFGCQSDRPKLTSSEIEQYNSEVAQFMIDHKLAYDHQGNTLPFTVGPNDYKTQILVKIQMVTKKMKTALKEEFGDLVKIVESDEIPTSG